MAPQTGSTKSAPDDIFVDPYTGMVLGSRHSGDLREGAKNTVPFVYDLHENLALGDAGALCLGVVALLWTFDCFVGLYLSFPVSRRSAEPTWLAGTCAAMAEALPALMVHSLGCGRLPTPL